MLFRSVCRGTRTHGPGQHGRNIRSDDSQDSVTSDGMHMSVIIDRTSGTPLGINVSACGQFLVVLDVISGGLVDSWNATHPLNQIKSGDRIFGVNDVHGDCDKLARALRDDGVLSIRLVQDAVNFDCNVTANDLSGNVDEEWPCGTCGFVNGGDAFYCVRCLPDDSDD